MILGAFAGNQARHNFGRVFCFGPTLRYFSEDASGSSWPHSSVSLVSIVLFFSLPAPVDHYGNLTLHSPVKQSLQSTLEFDPV